MNSNYQSNIIFFKSRASRSTTEINKIEFKRKYIKKFPAVYCSHIFHIGTPVTYGILLFDYLYHYY